MNRTTVALLLSAGLLCSVARAEDSPAVAAWIEQSRRIAEQLGAELKSELGRAMSAGGPVAAVGVCRLRAPEIAARLSAQSGAAVGRTALRVRNPANAPDDLQRAVLERFADELASGGVPGPLEATLEIHRGGQVERRYLRAIPMDGLCVACHGPVLAPDLAALIAREYPSDAATGFEPGQLRGAFVVTWPAVAPSPGP